MSVVFDKILNEMRDGKSSGGGGGGSSMPAGGMPFEALTSSDVPAAGKIYTVSPTDDTTFTFFTPVAGSPNAFRLVITQPSTPVAVVFPAGIWWGVDNNFEASNPAPTINEGNTAYGLVFEYDGTRFLGNLSYVVRLG